MSGGQGGYTGAAIFGINIHSGWLFVIYDRRELRILSFLEAGEELGAEARVTTTMTCSG
jgi:hypothetical protein